MEGVGVAERSSHAPKSEHIYAAFGVVLGDLRRSAGLSQGDVAAALGLKTYILVSQIELGRRRIVSEDLPLWADLLNVDRRAFAKVALRHFDPPAYAMIFGNAEPEPLQPRPRTSAP